MQTKKYLPEGYKVNTKENKTIISSLSGLQSAMTRGDIIEGIVMSCDNDYNMHLDLNGVHGIIKAADALYCRPDEEWKSVALIKRVGKPVSFKVLSIDTTGDEPIAKLSRRDAQIECQKEYLSKLSVGDIIPARVTRTDSFGAFVDIGCGIIALLPIGRSSLSRVHHTNERFYIDMDIFVVVDTIDPVNHRITVSLRELLGTWEENANMFEPGQTVVGKVRQVEEYGVFIELTPNLTGLAEVSAEDFDMETLKSYIGLSVAVFIKSMTPETMKIKLSIIGDSFTKTPIQPLKYFINTKKVRHISEWYYSPDCCTKKNIRTVFLEDGTIKF